MRSASIDLFHATDIHVTWGASVSGVPLTAGGSTRRLRDESEAHTRLGLEALVEHFRGLLAKGKTNWHLVLTGDITDVGASEELAEAARLLAPIWDPKFLTVVPGNHDAASKAMRFWADNATSLSVPRSFEAGRRAFRRTFGELMQSSRGFSEFQWPFVKVLRHLGIALVGVDSTDDTFVHATGLVGDWQLENLDAVLDRLNEDRRYRDLGVVVAIHHSPLVQEGDMALADAAEFLELCEGRVTAILNGHLHAAEFDWNGTPDDLPVLQGDSVSCPESWVPGSDYEAVPLVRYRLHAGDLRSLDDIEELEAPLEPVIRARQKALRDRYGDQLRAFQPCGECDGPVSPEMAFCPWCASETDFSSTFELVCPDCSQPVMPGYEFCPWCGVEFGGENEGRYATSRMTDECAECESGVEAYHAFCAACGVEQPEPDDEHPESCHDCDWPVDPEVHLFCPWCSAAQ